MFAYGETITLHSRAVTGQDSRGNDVYGEADTDVADCWFDPGTSGELLQGQDLVTTQPRVGVPAGTPVTAVDAVTVRGVRYDVAGTPDDWRSPYTGWNPGIVIDLKAVTG